MDIHFVIIVIGALIASYKLVRSNPSSEILMIVIMSIISVLLSKLFNPTIGFYLFLASLIVACIHVMTNKFVRFKGLLIAFLVPLVLAFIFSAFDLPGEMELRLLMIIPIGIFLYAFLKKEAFSEVIVIMWVFAAEALGRFLGIWF